VGKNADEPTGHPHGLARNFPARFKHISLETLAVVAEGTQPSSDPSSIFGPSAGAGVTSASARVKCEVCGESWEMSKIQQHMGAHILQEHWKLWPSKTRPRYPCGLC